MHEVDIERTPLHPGRWIWTGDYRKNHYVLFVRTVEISPATSTVHIKITASYHYELYLNGGFIGRGPVHGDAKWCSYDVLTYRPDPEETVLHIAAVVHHCSDTYLHFLTPAEGGLLACIDIDTVTVGTDETWRCRTLEMWNDNVGQRGWALGYCEDYDARLEPSDWREKRFQGDSADFADAALVSDADTIWSGYHERIVPYLRRTRMPPVSFTAWRADRAGAVEVYDISKVCDEEPLSPTGPVQEYNPDVPLVVSSRENAFTFDFGKELVGFYQIEIEAPEGTVIEISGSELLQDGSNTDTADSLRPWIFRKGTCYSVRYICRSGRQGFQSFTWNGFRYIHVVVRNMTAQETVGLHGLWCCERRAPLEYRGVFKTKDDSLAQIFSLCRRTLEVGVLEHTVDCPTREQAPAWADSAFISESIYAGFGDSSYLSWYLEAFIRAPFNEHGLICGRYPGTRGYWLDFCLIPMLAQRFHREHIGDYYKPRETLSKALELKRWYDAQTDDRRLIVFDFESYYKKGFRNFIDHPGLGMHNAGHVGIDRDGSSCALNAFFYGFVRETGLIAATVGDGNAAAVLESQANELKLSIRKTFWDGEVYHDAERLECDNERLSQGTSWQTNGLAVFLQIAAVEEAPGIMRKMLDGYDTVCRCTPYFHFYFLPALRMAGMEDEARDLIKREWGTMITAGATTTWEGFLGDERDSLCHPFSTAPFLFLLNK